MKRRYVKALSLLLAATVSTGGVTLNGPLKDTYAAEAEKITWSNVLTDEKVEELTQSVSYDRVSVHDPSVVYDNNGSYYIFGSHMGVAKSTDLKNWQNVTGEDTNSTLFANKNGDVVSYNEAFKDNAFTGDVTVKDKEGNEYQVDFGSYDISEWIADNTIQGNMWAPDVIYNDTMDKWCMYLSLNGAKWNSSIVLLTADDIEGPYVYQGPVVFSGFSSEDASKSYKDTDLELVIGDSDALPEKYDKISNETWGTYWPHAIDPCVFYDEDGRLLMSYGSWSGGIYMLELDKDTGLRDYTVTYESDFDKKGASVTSDEYFGKKIAGGYYVSGEGSYIQQIGDKYYLFMSYGFYSPEGGYNMRVFSSDNPYGPYVDENGNSAVFDKYIMNYSSIDSNNNRGLKLIGNYKWSTMDVAEVAQGHNSAVVTEDGSAYVVYHTKFNDGTAGHQIRVHQLFTNEDGQLLAAPYEYSGEKLQDTAFAKEDVVGDYELIIHDFQIAYADLEYNASKNVTLNEDGTITGAYTGTYEINGDNVNIVLNLDGKEYKGVLLEQNVDGTNIKTITFTGASKDGVTIWGSKVLGDEVVVAQNVKELVVDVPSVIYGDVELNTTSSNGATITWSSNNEKVLSSTGVVKKPKKDTEVTLTLTVSKGDTCYVKDYNVLVKADKQNGKDRLLVASYFDNEEVDISTGLDKSISIANPLYKGNTGGLDLSGGVTVEFDVKKTGDLHMLGTILSFMGNEGNAGRLYFTPGSYLGYNGSAGYFDANMQNYGLVNDYIGDEAHVAINFNNDGYQVVVNGEVAYTQDITQTDAGSATVTDYSRIVAWLNEQADKVYFGYGSWWNAAGFDEANCTISNLKFYAEPIIKTEYETLVSNPEDITITSATDITYKENPFYGEDIEELTLNYSITFAENAAKNGWDGIFSFFNKETGGRVSIQTAPYVCFNDGVGNWMDINQPSMSGIKNMAVLSSVNTKHDVTIKITKEQITIIYDGEELPIVKNSSGATYADILSYISGCENITYGVGQAVSSYWNTELCTLSDMTFEATVKKESEPVRYADAEVTNETAWGDYVKTNIKVTNNNEADEDNWKITFTYEGDIIEIWNAEILSHEGDEYVIKHPSWNKTLSVGETAEFGFIARAEEDVDIDEVTFVGAREEASKEAVNVEANYTGVWNGGFNGELVVTNNGEDTLEGVVIEFDYDDEITSMWGGYIVSSEDNHYVVRTYEYNSDITSGGTLKIGFSGVTANEDGSVNETLDLQNVVVTVMK